MFKLGLVINPVAGLGGSVALKGSDGDKIQQLALQRGAIPLAQSRMQQALQPLEPFINDLHIFTAANDMGENLCQQMGFKTTVLAGLTAHKTSAEDTEEAVQWCVEQGIDLLLFAGGDGTARNVYHALENVSLNLPVVGVPAGCKIHSAVYAVTPSHAGELLRLMIQGRALSLTEASVMDIDEDEFRVGRVKAKLHGYLSVPAENQFMQNMKQGGIIHQDIILKDIADYMIETMQDDHLYLIGSGTTPKAILDELNLNATLLGLDAVINQQLIANDVSSQQIKDLLKAHKNVHLIVTIIGGQGHLFGRGNQQISPEIIKHIGMDNIVIISTPEKIQSLNGQPIRVDTGDESLNKSLFGMVPVVTGYDEKILYRIA